MSKDFFNQNIDKDYINNCEESCSGNSSPFDIDIPGEGVCDPPQKVIINYGGGGDTPIGDVVFSVNGVSGHIVLDKNWVGLSEVDNTSDLSKPISILTQAALDDKISSGDPISLLFNDAGYITISALSDYYNRSEINNLLINKVSIGAEISLLDNDVGYITLSDIPAQIQADWNSTSGLSSILNKPDLSTYAQIGDNISIFNNDEGYITLSEVPPIDLSGYYTKTETDTLLDNKISIGDNVSELVNDSGYITNSDIPDEQTLSYSSATGNLTISGGNTVSLDGRYSLIGHTHPISDITGLQAALNSKVNTNLAITGSYGIIIGGSLSTALSIGLDTDVTDSRYLRKDINDSNGTNTLTIGNLIAKTATIESSFNLPSLSTGTSSEILVVGAGGLIQKRTLEIVGQFGVANNDGIKQFDVDLGTNLRFQGTGDTAVSFNPTTMTVTINSVPGQGGGGAVTSFNGRDGAVIPALGDYTTSIVSEGSNLYYTDARVRSTALTGLSASNTAILATDNILQALGKAQGQISAKANSSISLTVNGTAGRVLVSGGGQNLTANRTWTVDLANGIVTSGTYPKVTVDTYGRVISGASLVAADIPNLPTSKITSGVFDNARLGSGTAGAGTFLGANGWAVPPNTNTTYTGSTSITLSGTSFQRPALTGDVTSPANSNTLTIAGNSVTYAKMQNMSTQRLLGRGSAGTGIIQEITLGTNLSLTTAGVLNAANTNTTYTSSNGITLSGTDFRPNYGTGTGTIAQGNDSRILNGQTAFGWGDHNNKYLIRGENAIQGASLSFSGDLNTQTQNLIYSTGNNRPFDNNATILSLRGLGLYGGQLAFTSSSVYGLSYRKIINGVWEEWKEVWDSSNLPDPLQTLSLFSGAGQINISGGNTIALTSLLAVDSPDAEESFTGLKPYTNTGGSMGYPTELGGGLGFRRGDARAFDIHKVNDYSQDYLYYRTRASANTFNSWKIIANREWVNSNYRSSTDSDSRYLRKDINDITSGTLTIQDSTLINNTQIVFNRTGAGNPVYISADGVGNGGIYIRVRNTSNTWINSLYIKYDEVMSLVPLSVTGNITATGDILSYTTSDLKLKDFIKTITNPLDKLSKISGNSFKWNSKQDTYEVGLEDYGVIAQEIEEVLPYAITTRDNGYKAVKYDRIIPLLIEGIKEQTKLINKLQEEVIQLKGGIN